MLGGTGLRPPLHGTRCFSVRGMLLRALAKRKATDRVRERSEAQKIDNPTLKLKHPNSRCSL